MESGDGTLSATEFRVAACAFSELWKTFNSSLPQWSWVPSLKRSCVHYQNEDDVMEEVECSSAEEDDFIDTAKLVRNQDSGAHHYNFHIVYSLSYRVPVLYFRAYCSDGQPLALKDIEKDIPVNSVQLLTKSKWTFLTQEEHPILHLPWYTLHPCGTVEWMRLLLGNKTCIDQGGLPIDKYLVSWFSVVGQVFGLKIPLEMV
ncbi:ubiquitin-like-conjugating enzyme ATG10 isoform X3 [Primulina huaijiensis]|uniref:ubiquitin-like-conjugating enzyme ATG10 isoform X3 n=1 Tax=Primulina huaijiensis TaxID=1492673 RepID=UPI003CC6DE80